MSNPKVTVIIPAYNAEKFVHTCIESAIQQTLNDIEILCIDDCSTDSTPNILSKFAKNDTRITIFTHTLNKGEGASRNTGLDNARGDYIFHLDADDTIPFDALEKLYDNAMRYNCDMVKGRYDIILKNGSTELLSWSTPDNKIINTNIYASTFLQKIPTSHCTYLYKREFLNQHKIRYRTDLVIGLDLIALTTALVNANTITLIPDTVYHYFQSDNSAIRGNLTIDIANDAIRTKKIIAELLNKKGLHEAATAFLQAWSYIIETHWLRMPLNFTLEECSQTFSTFRNLIEENDIIPWVAGTPNHHRYILALVLSNQDQEALTFLSSDEASNGFATKEKLIDSLNYILEQVPYDAGTLIELGHIARKDGDMGSALELFTRATKQDESNFDANFQIATILKELGQFEEAGSRLDIALETLIKGYNFYDQIKLIISAKENTNKSKYAFDLSSVLSELRSAQSELNNARNELLKTQSTLTNVRDELNLVYTSTSWKITKPLRNIISHFKRSA